MARSSTKSFSMPLAAPSCFKILHNTDPWVPGVLLLASACCLLLAFCGPLCAQESSEPTTAHVPTLEQVQALPPEEEALDLYRFENPVTVEPNTFERFYDPGITPEEMALQHGGYINYGINLGLYKSWQGIKKVTGMRPDIQHAAARPPPLSEAQLLRAAKFCDAQADDCAAAD